MFVAICVVFDVMNVILRSALTFPAQQTPHSSFSELAIVLWKAFFKEESVVITCPPIQIRTDTQSEWW